MSSYCAPAPRPGEAIAAEMTDAAALEDTLAHEDFKRLEMLTQACPNDFCSRVMRFPTACSHAAMSKNRYTNVLADEPTRVRLKKDKHGEADDAAADYINANYLLGGSFIAAQAPLPATFGDFWTMVWQHRSPVVVMLTKLEERGRHKADRYWPEHQGARTIYGGFQVTLEQCTPGTHFETRVFLIEPRDPVAHLSPPRRVTHFLFSAWPDFGAPSDTLGIRSLVAHVARARHDAGQLGGPTIVHCSAGIGRSGTFIAIADAVHRIDNDRPIDVLGTVLQMRKERTGMIQTAEQYSFVLKAIGDHVASLNAAAAATGGRKKPLHGSSPSPSAFHAPPAALTGSPLPRRTFSLSDLECVVAGGPRRSGDN